MPSIVIWEKVGQMFENKTSRNFSLIKISWNIKNVKVLLQYHLLILRIFPSREQLHTDSAICSLSTHWGGFTPTPQNPFHATRDRNCASDKVFMSCGKCNWSKILFTVARNFLQAKLYKRNFSKFAPVLNRINQCSFFITHHHALGKKEHYLILSNFLILVHRLVCIKSNYIKIKFT